MISLGVTHVLRSIFGYATLLFGYLWGPIIDPYLMNTMIIVYYGPNLLAYSSTWVTFAFKYLYFTYPEYMLEMSDSCIRLSSWLVRILLVTGTFIYDQYGPLQTMTVPEKLFKVGQENDG